MRKLALISLGVAALALAGCEKKAENATAAPEAATPEAAAPADNMAVSSSTGDPAANASVPAGNEAAPADASNMSAPNNTTEQSSASGKI